MRKITAIEVQKRRPNRVNIHLDGEFAFGLARIVAAWLRVGQELSEEKIEELQAKNRATWWDKPQDFDTWKDNVTSWQ